MFTRFRGAALICALGAGLMAGCGGSSQPAPSTSATTPATATAPSTTTPAAQPPAATTNASQTSTTATTHTGPQIQVTPQMIATAKVACGYVDQATGPFKATLAQACGQLTSGDVAGAVATYNTICHTQAATGTTAVEQAMLAKACPTLVLH